MSVINVDERLTFPAEQCGLADSGLLGDSGHWFA
ncbi:hypothetical protein MYIN104542_12710 [Mycobacterium intermedium]